MYYSPLLGKSNCTPYNFPTNAAEVAFCQVFTSLKFVATDFEGNTSAVNNVDIVVVPQNYPPVPTCPATIRGIEDTPLVVNLTGTDVDLVGTLRSFLENFPDHVTVYQYPYNSNGVGNTQITPLSNEVTDSQLRVVFVFDENWNGQTTFSYFVYDGLVNTSKAITVSFFSGKKHHT